MFGAKIVKSSALPHGRVLSQVCSSHMVRAKRGFHQENNQRTNKSFVPHTLAFSVALVGVYGLFKWRKEREFGKFGPWTVCAKVVKSDKSVPPSDKLGDTGKFKKGLPTYTRSLYIMSIEIITSLVQSSHYIDTLIYKINFPVRVV
jgi:hypothetical protein